MSRRRSSPLVPFLGLLAVLASVAAGFMTWQYLKESRGRYRADQQLGRTRTRLAGEQEKSRYAAQALGHEGVEDLDQLRRLVQGDLQPLVGEDVGYDYRTLVATLSARIDALQDRVDALGDRNDGFRREIGRMRPAYEAQMAVLAGARKEAVDDLVSEQESAKRSRRLLEERAESLAAELRRVTDDLRQAYDETEQVQTAADDRIRMLNGAVRTFRQREQPPPDALDEPPDGQVLYTDVAADTVTVDLGKDSGVRPGTTLNVYRADPDGRPEGRIAVAEVIRVEDRRSVARVTQSQRTEPIVRGDLVYSPLLRDGAAQVFALAGTLDYDSDGRDDSARIRDFLKRSGAVVEYQLHPDGRADGEITQRCKYLVSDTPPSDSSREYLLALSAARRAAIDRAIPIVSSRRFVDILGAQSALAERRR